MLRWKCVVLDYSILMKKMQSQYQKNMKMGCFILSLTLWKCWIRTSNRRFFFVFFFIAAATNRIIFLPLLNRKGVLLSLWENTAPGKSCSRSNSQNNLNYIGFRPVWLEKGLQFRFTILIFLKRLFCNLLESYPYLYFLTNSVENNNGMLPFLVFDRI